MNRVASSVESVCIASTYERNDKMVQERKDKQTSKQTEEVEETPAKDLKNEELDASVEDTLSKIDEELEDLDGILDEIDDVLEVNAEEFVNNYVQKGGQ